MRYIHFYGNAGFCGTDYHEFVEYPDDTPDSEIDATSEDLRYGNAETFSYCYTGWGEDFEDEDDEEQYFADAEGNWEELPKAEWKAYKKLHG